MGKELLFDPPNGGEFNSFNERYGIFRRFFVSRKFFAPLFSEKSGKTNQNEQ
jgi:hypothetical protein